MPAYTSITIIFNPNSTGNGKQLAEELRDALIKKDSKLPVKLVPTTHAGHAETLARKAALATKRPLVMSASGDGGYHEVVNGVMTANHKGAHAVVGLLPAGNANDHYQHMHNTDIVKSIVKQKEQQLDLLTLKTRSHNKSLERYSHSYIGIGLTSKVGRELNKTKLNWFNEIAIVLRVLFFLHPVCILVDGKICTYDSLVFSNIAKMSKVLTLSKEASATDGRFEMTAFKTRSKLKLMSALIHASTVGLTGQEQLREYTFKTVKPILVQLDGEISKIDADSDVEIGIMRKALACIV